jgi:hypothetical protein
MKKKTENTFRDSGKKGQSERKGDLLHPISGTGKERPTRKDYPILTDFLDTLNC